MSDPPPGRDVDRQERAVVAGLALIEMVATLTENAAPAIATAHGVTPTRTIRAADGVGRRRARGPGKPDWVQRHRRTTTKCPTAKGMTTLPLR
jgi:hypothetical protein